MVCNKYNTLPWKALRCACGHRHQKDCNSWVTVKWWKEGHQEGEERRLRWKDGLQRLTVWTVTCAVKAVAGRGLRWVCVCMRVCVCSCPMHSLLARLSWMQFTVFAQSFLWMKSCISKHEISVVLKLFWYIHCVGTNLHFQNKHYSKTECICVWVLW